MHKLDIHTVGAVVTEAQPLMEVVPEGTPMEVEAWMENQDVGFVIPQMPVEIKVDAFNFQKFGTLKGKVREISPDAIEDKERITSFPVNIKTIRTFISVWIIPLIMAIFAGVSALSNK